MTRRPGKQAKWRSNFGPSSGHSSESGRRELDPGRDVGRRSTEESPSPACSDVWPASIFGKRQQEVGKDIDKASAAQPKSAKPGSTPWE